MNKSERKNINPYYRFLNDKIRFYHYTIAGFAKKYNLPSLSSIMNHLKRDPDKNLHPATLKEIEDAFSLEIGTKVVIDYSDIQNIHFKTVSSGISSSTGENNIINTKSNSYPLIEGDVLSKVVKEQNKVVNKDALIKYADEHLLLQYPEPNCFLIKNIGDKNEYYILPDDLLLVDLSLKPSPGNWVTVVSNNNLFVGRYKKISDHQILVSHFNTKYENSILKLKDCDFIGVIKRISRRV